MAIINKSYGFVFIHVPKAAGTAISTALSQFTNYCDLEIGATHFGENIQSAYIKRFNLSKHSPASHVKAIMGDIDWKRNFTFSFARNPYERALSTFFFLKGWDGLSPDLKKEINAFESFKEFVLSGFWNDNEGPDRIFRPQVYWLTSEKDPNQIIIDFVGKVESLEKDLQRVMRVINPNKFVQDNIQLKQLNKGVGGKKDDLNDKQVREVIYKKYKRDFEILGYKKSCKG